MVIALSIALAMQVVPASGASLSCSFVTPSAQAIDFAVVEDSSVAILPRAASIWPSAPLQARRASGRTHRIIVGDRDGLVLDVGEIEGRSRAIALLSRWNGRQPTYPVAVGTCQTSSGTASAPDLPPVPFSASDNIAAFDPRQWPSDCGLLLDDGRRVRFDYTITGPGGPVRIESQVLWGSRPVTTRWSGGPGGASRFGGGIGPSGSERMLSHDGLLVKIIQFSRIGDPAVSARSGLGICGYNNVVRRPNSR